MAENQYDNEGRFVIFPNTRKEEGSKQPDYTGEITIDGVKKRLSGWRNVSKAGATYLAGRISDFQEAPSDGAQASAAVATAAPATAPATRDDIPF